MVQVVGHSKTCLILLGGFVLFPTADGAGAEMGKNLLGICIAMAGVFWYTYLRLHNL